MAGATASATTGSDGLTVTMKAKAAVLCIVGVNKDDILDISVKDAEGKYISGLKADKNSADFKVETKDTKVTLLSTSGAGVYYIVVPVGVKLEVYNGATLIKKTKDAGLKAGKYYTLLTGKTTGSATNKLGETISWVQLWAGGPKFATKNVKEAMTWTDAVKTGDDFAWGKNWRTPTADEVYGEGKLYAQPDENYHMKPVAGSPSFKIIKEGENITLVFTGVQPGYTKNTLTLYNKSGHGNYNFDFWTSSEKSGYGKRFNISAQDAETEGFEIGYFWISSFDNKNTKYLVRPVLAK